MQSFSYRLPWPPSTNSYWRTGTARNGIPMTYLTAKAKEFRVSVAEIVAAECDGMIPTLRGRLAVNIELIAPTRRKCDLDNFCKSTLDALMHAGVFEDDNQIDQLQVRRLHVESPGCADVTITEL